MSEARPWYFSSESVTQGHPDKVADSIADAILDEVLAVDLNGRVGCEVLVTRRTAVIAGEITAAIEPDVEQIARDTIRTIGYDGFDPEFDAETLDVLDLVQPQSPDIAEGVSVSEEARFGSEDSFDAVGAGDQGIMFGFACDETPELMPLPIQLAHRLAERLALVRTEGTLDYLRPDGKTQVTVLYQGSTPVAVTNVLISAHHAPGVDMRRMRDDLAAHVSEPVLAERLQGDDVPLIVNPSGRFEVGGPPADTGLTGRKIIVDTYGGYSRHGGGAFSGKDPTKVDRSAGYAARHAAKNVVASGVATRCEVQLAYAIGRAHPFSVHLDTFGTSEVDPERLEKLLVELFDFRPAAIIERFGLRRPIFSATSCYGHFGRPGFPWEQIDMADVVAAEAAGL